MASEEEVQGKRDEIGRLHASIDAERTKRAELVRDAELASNAIQLDAEIERLNRQLAEEEALTVSQFSPPVEQPVEPDGPTDPLEPVGPADTVDPVVANKVEVKGPEKAPADHPKEKS